MKKNTMIAIATFALVAMVPATALAHSNNQSHHNSASHSTTQQSNGNWHCDQKNHTHNDTQSQTQHNKLHHNGKACTDSSHTGYYKK